MAQRWFANIRNSARIELPEIEGWIEVREELSVGEERKIFGRAIKGQTELADGEKRTDYDMERVSFGLVVAYLTDWSARDEHDKPVLLSEDAIRALDPHVYEVIEKAVDTHAKAVRERKKTQRRTPDAVPTLSSVAS
jgi:hypothetical protein